MITTLKEASDVHETLSKGFAEVIVRYVKGRFIIRAKGFNYWPSHSQMVKQHSLLKQALIRSPA